MTAAERLLRYVQFDTQSNEFSDTCPVERPETPAPNEGEARFEQRYDEHRVREFSSAGACRASICVR